MLDVAVDEPSETICPNRRLVFFTWKRGGVFGLRGAKVLETCGCGGDNDADRVSLFFL